MFECADSRLIIRISLVSNSTWCMMALDQGNSLVATHICSFIYPLYKQLVHISSPSDEGASEFSSCVSSLVSCVGHQMANLKVVASPL